MNTFPEFSIAFWRWAIWKLFESQNAPKKGVIAFISNRTFLAGHPYAGLRQMLRERFDRLEIIDLRGDVRMGARAGVAGDVGVFNIQVGTAITIAIADGSKADGERAEVHYIDSWDSELFSRESKLKWLEQGAASGTRPGAVLVSRGWLDDLRPEPFQAAAWPSIKDCFQEHGLGIQSKRDHLVYAISKGQLRNKIQEFLGATESEAARVGGFRTQSDAARARTAGLDESLFTLVAYRPLDRRWHYSHPRYNYSLRPYLFHAFTSDNRALYVLRKGTGSGPAAWCHGQMPDYHSFRGSYGGYAFPLYDHRPGHHAVNLTPELIDGLSLAYHSPVDAGAVFDAMLALLSASSYTLRFAEDLEDVFPHVPFPASRELFEQAATIGAAIREVETFARPPDPALLPETLARLDTTPTGPLAASDIVDGELRLCADGSGLVTGIPKRVWDFSVSGYRVLPRWLAAREGVEVDDAFRKEFVDIVGRITELIHRFDEADLVLEATLNHTLTRDDLGL